MSKRSLIEVYIASLSGLTPRVPPIPSIWMAWYGQARPDQRTSLGTTKNETPGATPGDAARRVETAQERTENGAVSGPRTAGPNPVRKSLGRALAKPRTTSLGGTRSEAKLAQMLGHGFGTCLARLWPLLRKRLAMASCGKCLAMARPSHAPAPAWHGVSGYHLLTS